MNTIDETVTTKAALLKALKENGVVINTHTILNWEKEGLFIKPQPKQRGKPTVYPRPLPELVTWALFLYRITNARLFNYKELSSLFDRQEWILNNTEAKESLSDELLTGKDSIRNTLETMNKELKKLSHQMEGLFVCGLLGIFDDVNKSPGRLDELVAIDDLIEENKKVFKKSVSYTEAIFEYMNAQHKAYTIKSEEAKE